MAGQSEYRLPGFYPGHLWGSPAPVGGPPPPQGPRPDNYRDDTTYVDGTTGVAAGTGVVAGTYIGSSGNDGAGVGRRHVGLRGR